jgi:ribonuclease HI
MKRIYTDGACSNNGRAGASASYACVFPDRVTDSFAFPLPAEENHTNQTAELYAIYQGALKAREWAWEDVTLLTDSQYSKNCLTTWYSKWKRNGWKTSEGKDVIHRVLLEKIADVLQQFDSYVITHVPAHTGGGDENSRWNDVADRMAVKALEVKGPVKYADVLEVKQVHCDPVKPVLPGLPLVLMGPPVSEKELTSYLLANLPVLLNEDEKAVHAGLIAILKKMLLKRGLEMEKQTLNKRPVYRLVEKSHLKVERVDNTQDAGECS